MQDISLPALPNYFNNEIRQSRIPLEALTSLFRTDQKNFELVHPIKLFFLKRLLYNRKYTASAMGNQYQPKYPGGIKCL